MLVGFRLVAGCGRKMLGLLTDLVRQPGSIFAALRGDTVCRLLQVARKHRLRFDCCFFASTDNQPLQKGGWMLSYVGSLHTQIRTHWSGLGA